jgi:hypothetical protein
MENLAKLAETDAEARRLFRRLAETKDDEYVKALQEAVEALAARQLKK